MLQEREGTPCREGWAAPFTLQHWEVGTATLSSLSHLCSSACLSVLPHGSRHFFLLELNRRNEDVGQKRDLALLPTSVKAQVTSSSVPL